MRTAVRFFNGTAVLFCLHRRSPFLEVGDFFFAAQLILDKQCLLRYTYNKSKHIFRENHAYEKTLRKGYGGAARSYALHHIYSRQGG